MWSAALVLLVTSTVLLARPAAAAPLRVQSRPKAAALTIQALCQLTVYAYWGYWRPVYDHAWLLAAQLAFVYGLDMLLLVVAAHAATCSASARSRSCSARTCSLWFRDDWCTTCSS
ncbi:MAG: hypothetical protein R2712_18145 [Vicinamibacterales bacterium]